MYAGYTESDEKIAARKARIVESSSPNLSVDDVPEPGYCSPLAYAAMTPEQRAEYDRRMDAMYPRSDSYSVEKIKFMLGELSPKNKLNAYDMLLYLGWREGSITAMPLEIIHGAWVFHTGELKDMYRGLKNQIGNSGIAALLAVVIYCLLFMAKGLL